MVGIAFVLLFIINALNANIDEREGRSAKGAFVNTKRFFWAEQREEDEQRKRKKFRLGSTANKEGKTNNRQLTPVKVSMLEDKVRLSYEPVAYKPEKNVDFIPLSEKIKFQTQVRHHEYNAHQPLKPIYLRAAE